MAISPIGDDGAADPRKARDVGETQQICVERHAKEL
jgi:hypothetical protein